MDKITNEKYYYSLLSKSSDVSKMNGARRVIVFCILTAVLPTTLIVIALYLRHSKYVDVKYAVSESDVVEIRAGQSSIFCEEHSLRMNSSFNAFQMRGSPELSNSRKHIRLRKSMSLPDDTLEYWGFYLLKGATVRLKVCSRHKGSRVLVIRGERDLRTCGLLDNKNDKFGPSLAEGHDKVVVTFDAPAELVDMVNHPKYLNGNTVMHSSGEETFSNEDLNTYKTELNSPINKEDTLNKVVSDNQITEILLNSSKSNNPNAFDFISSHTHKRREIGHIPNHVLDGGVNHGGNAMNYTDAGEENSVSSFENELLQCFDGKILLNQGFEPSKLCENVHYLDTSHQSKMLTTHEVLSNGYYYYIFFSDNDNVNNDIHAIFDIYKPTFQYANLPESKQCLNKTACNFPIPFMSAEVVIVEVPTRDGIEQEEDDITYLISSCHPRMVIYAIFPISVLLIVLICAFL